MNQAIFNPWAPPVLNGFNAVSPDNCEDVDAGFVWPENNGFQIMTANQQIDVNIVLDQGADFRFMAFIWSLQSIEGGPTPGFLYRIKDADGRYTSDGFVYSFCTPGTLANPWPQFPNINYANHQQIQFEIINVASVNQGVQVMFRGEKRFSKGGR